MNTSNKALVFVGDLMVLGLSLLSTIAISFPKDFSYQLSVHLGPFTLMYLIWVIIFYIFNLYDPKQIKITIKNSQFFIVAILIAGAISIILFYLFPIFSITPKTNLAINLILFSGVFILWRSFIGKAVSKKFFERVAILGDSPEVEKIHNQLAKKNQFGYRSFGYSPSLEDIKNIIKQHKVTKVIIGTKLHTLDLFKLTRIGVDSIPLINLYEQIYERIPLNLITDEEALEILNTTNSPVYKAISRSVSFIVSLCVLITTLPITLLAAILIYAQDRGSVFYVQERTGEKHKKFNLLKFRTMIIDAEKAGAQWAQKSDIRITKIGKILRKTHIDEIPQMINILRGDINLVGPRPERPVFVQELENEIPYYFLRHDIKPGFTGWAQIKFRYARTIDDSAKKLEYDLYYLKNRNLALDLGIILKTVQIIFTH